MDGDFRLVWDLRKLPILTFDRGRFLQIRLVMERQTHSARQYGPGLARHPPHSARQSSRTDVMSAFPRELMTFCVRLLDP